MLLKSATRSQGNTCQKISCMKFILPMNVRMPTIVGILNLLAGKIHHRVSYQHFYPPPPPPRGDMGFISVRRCTEPMTQLPRQGHGHRFTLEFHVRSISPEPFERFSLNFTQMFLSMRRCAEPMFKGKLNLRTSKNALVKVF